MDDVVVSIICTNNCIALRGCLEALPEACAGLQWRAVVVDNASSDGTSEMVHEDFPWAAVIRNSRRFGFAHNHNLVIRPSLHRTDARYLMVLNDDTRLDPGSVLQMVHEMDEKSHVGALGPQIRGLDGELQQSLYSFPSMPQLLLQQFQPSRPSHTASGHGWLNGSCILLRREALEEAGPLDERYFLFFEDTDLCYRLLQSGWTSAVARKSGMVHMEHQTVNTPELSSAMARQMLRSQWLYIASRSGRLSALILSAGTRLALYLRYGKAVLQGAMGDKGSRTLARQLLVLATYRPAQPLPHESG